MLNWFKSVVGAIGGGISSAVRAFVDAVLSPIIAALDALFGDVFKAWSDLAGAVEAGAVALGHYLEHDYDVLRQIIGYDIPHFAQLAWWWVTHPAALAKRLFWYLVRELEDNALAATKYLGSFALGLLIHHAEDVAKTLEDIVTAVL